MARAPNDMTDRPARGEAVRSSSGGTSQRDKQIVATRASSYADRRVLKCARRRLSAALGRHDVDAELIAAAQLVCDASERDGAR